MKKDIDEIEQLLSAKYRFLLSHQALTALFSFPARQQW